MMRSGQARRRRFAEYRIFFRRPGFAILVLCCSFAGPALAKFDPPRIIEQDKPVALGHDSGQSPGKDPLHHAHHRFTAGLIDRRIQAGSTYDFVTDGMIEAKGYGEERPIVDNKTSENKALNRRIEVIVWE